MFLLFYSSSSHLSVSLFISYLIKYLCSPRIQELLKSEHHEEGRVPRTVECELTEDLVDACIPEDIVTVTGIIRVINNYMDIGGGKWFYRGHDIYLFG